MEAGQLVYSVTQAVTAHILLAGLYSSAKNRHYLLMISIVLFGAVIHAFMFISLAKVLI